MHRGRLFIAFLGIAILTIAGAAPASAVVPPSDSEGIPTGAVPGYAIVILTDPPLAEWPGVARQANGKLDFSNGANGRYTAALAHERNDFKQWLNSAKSSAKVIREYDTVLNGLAVELNGASLDSLRAGPGVTLVEPSLSFAPAMDRSLALIKAAAMWNAVGGVANAGAGMKVGVIDTGIDQAHPFLTDDSLTPPAGFPKCDPGGCGFTSKKVIVARVYYTGRPGLLTAQALQEHGTHVAGTIAGVNNTTAPADGPMPSVSSLSGVAPKAFLGNYNVFPGTMASATSHDIAQAIEDAVKDGMDVINMSLGGGIAGYQDQLTVATNRAVEAGVVVAVAAGNSGPGANTVGSPAQAALAITAGASTNSHYFGVNVKVGAYGTTAAANYGAAAGAFNPFSPAVSATLANWSNPSDPAGATRACAGLSGTPYSGKILIVDRGSCTFSTKIRNAQNAGSVGVLVVNNSAGDPVAMGQDGTPNQPTIPALMAAMGDRTAIRAAGIGGATASADGSSVLEIVTNNGNILAGFSSRGPSNLLDVKPDVLAPGVNILSSVPGGKYAVFQGTSMATPHVAGSAALLRQLHPSWTPVQVKSALVDTAFRDPKIGTNNPQNRGGGVIDLAAASAVPAVLDPASLSFRKIEPESGRSKTIDVTVTNTTSSTQTHSISAALTFCVTSGAACAASGATASASVSTLTLAPSASGTVSVTIDTTHESPNGQYWGDLTLTVSGKTLRAPLWFIVRTWVDAGPLV